MRSRLCPFGLAHGIPPTAVGGWLRSSLKRLRPSSIPPTAVGGWLRFSLPDLLSSPSLKQGGWTLTIPQLPLGGLKREKASDVGRTLTIPQLPLGGLKNDPQICGVCFLC